jgi:polyhydroxyalkanoate synthesis regulator phasin
VPSMLFRLTGRDELSDVFDDIGDAARRMGRRITVASIEADREMRRLGRTTASNLAGLRRDSDAGAKAVEELGKVTKMLWPAALPVAASMAPIAAGAGTVAVALGAMTAAVIPQIKAMGEASEAQKAYEDAVAKSGARSDEAIKAQAEYARVMEELPPATREAAATFGVLKDSYKEWSDSLADDTMAPVIKGMQLTNALLPKTTGLVKSASAEFDRFLTNVGGQMASPGFDALNSKFSTFADKTLRKVNDEIVHMMRVSDGQVGGPVKDFMEYARAQGPLVGSVLSSLATTLVNVLRAGSDLGVGMLQVVDVLARLVSAVPPGAIALFLQLALAMKLVKVAALGMAAARTALASFGASLVAMNTAAGAATGRLATVRAAIGALSRTAKLAIAGTGIGLLVIALSELAERSGNAPPDVDKLTSSLRQLGATGRVTGEAAKAFGKDLDGLHGKVRALTDPSTADKVQQFLVGWTGWDSTPVKEAKENLDSVDKALASLVSSGQSDLAAAALKRLTAEYGKGGRDTKEFTSQLNDYKSAVADAKFESELAAEAQGLFGAQAQSVQEKLNAQKMSADGLRQSIAALNETSRSAFDAETKFEAAIDNVTKALKDNGATLDKGTEKGRANRDALSQLGAATEDAATKARENGASWSTVTGIYDRGRRSIIANAQAMGATKAEAKALADQILKTPNKTARLRGDMEDLERKLAAAKSKLAKVPDSRKAQVRATIDQLTRQIEAARRQLDGIDGKTATTYVVTHYSVQGATGEARNLKKLKPGHYASGGSPEAGEVAMVGENGPELVMFGEAARVFDATTTRSLMSGTVSAARAATDGLVGGLQSSSGVYAAARVMAAAVTQGIRDELEIRSPSKKTKALAADIGKGLIIGLTGSRDRIRSVAKDLATDIRTAFSGRKESTLIAYVTRQTRALLTAAAKRDAVAAKIAEAKAFVVDVANKARGDAALGSLGMEAEDVTAGGIKGALASKLAKIKQFTRYVGTLAKRGLNKGLIRQILEMGPEAGYAYASALAGADKATFNEINKLQAGVIDSTRYLGRFSADHLYDAGKNAGRGFLTGLASQQKAIENTMIRIAKAMQKALKKALGIKSPAREMMPDGVMTVRGVAEGVLQGLPYVDRAMQTVAGRMAGKAAASPVMGRPAVVGGGASVMQVQISVTDARDPVATAREIRRELLELKRLFGQNFELKVG